jgi:hypothetical protein
MTPGCLSHSGVTSSNVMPTINRTVAIFALFGLCCFAFGQDGEKMTFHVTAVSSAEARDWCTTGKCNAIRLTVEGYSITKGDATSTAYVLNCVEVIMHDPTPHISYPCIRLHANRNYDATLFADSITFGSTSPSQPVAGYTIVSEKEVSKQTH